MVALIFVRRLIGAMLAVSLALGIQVFGPTLIPYLATDAAAADVLPGLVPELTLSASTDDGFVVTVSNYDPSYYWDLTTTQGGVSFKLPTTVNPFSISVRHLPTATSATLTVYTSREGYADGSASIVGCARTPTVATPTPTPVPVPEPTASPTPTSTATPDASPTPTPIDSTPAPSIPVLPTINPATELAIVDQRANDMQQTLIDDELKTTSDVIALTQRIIQAITNQIRAEDRRLVSNAKAIAKLSSKTLPKARSKSSSASLLTPGVRRALRGFFPFE